MYSKMRMRLIFYELCTVGVWNWDQCKSLLRFIYTERKRIFLFDLCRCSMCTLNRIPCEPIWKRCRFLFGSNMKESLRVIYTYQTWKRIFLWCFSLSWFEWAIKLDSLWTHLESMSLSLSCQYKQTLTDEGGKTRIWPSTNKVLNQRL